MSTLEALQSALASLVDPETGKDYVSTRCVKNLKLEDGRVSVEIVLGYPAKSRFDEVRDQVSLHRGQGHQQRSPGQSHREDDDAARRADALLAISDAMRGDMIALGMPADRIETVRTGVDLDRFVAGRRAAARAALGLPAEQLSGVTAQIKVVDNTLKLNVTKIVNKADDAKTEAEENPVQTIAFPNQSLISVRSGQDGAQFTGARMSSDTARPGDTNFDITADTTVSNANDYTYGFVSGNGLSAGLWSNSEHDGTTVGNTVAGGARNTRVLTSTASGSSSRQTS